MAPELSTLNQNVQQTSFDNFIGGYEPCSGVLASSSSACKYLDNFINVDDIGCSQGDQLSSKDPSFLPLDVDLTTDWDEVLSDVSFELSDKQMYCLALVDAETGVPVRPATTEELADVVKLLGVDSELNLGLSDAGDLGEVASEEKAAQPHSAYHYKTGGPCDHCGATASPQWRRGPPAKPVLCNACGTRYRRTNQLGPQTSLKAHGSIAKKQRVGMYKPGCNKQAQRLAACSNMSACQA